MGQTLTHGIYLPDEGERNCYNGLAANWSILDGAVGTIAEHTSALAGKAPLVHTHSKSDITNLFNSANKWTGINTYTTALRFSAANYSAGTPSSDIFYGSLLWGGIVNNSFVQSFGINNAIRTTGINDISLRVYSQTGSTMRGVAVETNADASDSSFRPLVNNVTNLGSSSYQWNNLYAKNYYYNGTAWGLDKANVWSAENTFTSNNINIQRPFILGDNTYQVARLQILDSASTPQRLSTFNFVHYNNNSSRLEIGIYGLNSNNEIKNRFLLFQLEPDDTSSFFPLNNSQINLGTSTNKWKTFNGLNPGALSLPNFDSDGYTDLSSDLTENVQYTYTPVVDGWLALYAQVNGFHAENAVGIFNADLTLGNNSFRWANTATAAINLQRQTGKYFGSVILPVRAGYPYYCWLRVDQSTTLGQKKLIFYKAKGNV